MKEIVVLRFNSNEAYTSENYEIFGEKFHITTYGVDYDFDLAKTLINKFKKDVSSIAILGLSNSIRIGNKTINHKEVSELLNFTDEVPIEDGQLLREMYIQWQFDKMIKSPDFRYRNKKIGFFCALAQFNYLSLYQSIASKLIFADPYFVRKIPLILTSQLTLGKILLAFESILSRVTISKIGVRDFRRDTLKMHIGMREFINCDIYVVNETQLPYINTNLVQNKLLMLDSVSEDSMRLIQKLKPADVISFNPSINGRKLNFSILACMLRSLKDENTPLDFDEVLPYLETLTPPVFDFKSSNLTKPKRKFGFLIHPLKKSDLFGLNILKPFKKISAISTAAEKLSQFVPGYLHGKVLNISSINSDFDVEGNLYIVPMTPKMLLKSDPDKFYEKVNAIIKKSKEDGCELFGLGAYTKIVGDAGITINKHSPLPVTTGNSLSSASTLWAANYAVEKMGFVENSNGKFLGKVMVVGATGSIGKVTAKLVAHKWKEVVLIAPRPHNLLKLKEEMEQIHPDANIIYSTEANKHISDCDLIITTTSNQKGSILDIKLVQPGAVICDVSRPFDITEKEAVTRPDVLVIASGEVELPGEVKVTNNIGLHGSVVYACLAETALLALDNRCESFSLSRSLSYEKVKEIDRIARKHGVKLAAIMGHRDEITPEEIELCRLHATRYRTMIKSDAAHSKLEETNYV